jgi:hypothetical protein
LRPAASARSAAAIAACAVVFSGAEEPGVLGGDYGLLVGGVVELHRVRELVADGARERGEQVEAGEDRSPPAVLQVASAQPEEPHVEDEVQPPAVQKGIRRHAEDVVLAGDVPEAPLGDGVERGASVGAEPVEVRLLFGDAVRRRRRQQVQRLRARGFFERRRRVEVRVRLVILERGLGGLHRARDGGARRELLDDEDDEADGNERRGHDGPPPRGHVLVGDGKEHGFASPRVRGQDTRWLVAVRAQEDT